jgi:hypothetical protein
VSALMVAPAAAVRAPVHWSVARLPRRPQRVEKVGIELIAIPNRAPRAPKSARLVRAFGRKRAPREFFNTLTDSTHFGE